MRNAITNIYMNISGIHKGHNINPHDILIIPLNLHIGNPILKQIYKIANKPINLLILYHIFRYKP